MGRFSSTGYPFLILRPDAGQYTYHRALDPSVAAFVTGDVDLAWCWRRRSLSGKPTIKVSLATGDLKTAQQRWVVIHAQVDALVRLAEIQARRPAPVEHAPSGEPLDRADIRVMAGQAYHDVLDADDQGQIDRDCCSPVGKLLLRLAARGDQRQTPTDRQVAELAARRIEHGLATSRLRRRATWIIDRPIVESECDARVLDQLKPDLQDGDRLAPEQVEALARGIHIGDIPSEVDIRLKENGIDLPADHRDRRAIALAITRAKLRGLNDVAKRDRGAPIDTPARPVIFQPAVEPIAPLLSTMRPLWIAERRPGAKEQDDKALYLRYFQNFHGDLPVDKITPPMISSFLLELERRPRNVAHALQGATLQDQIAWGLKSEQRDKPRLSRGTVNAKGLGAISALLEQALKRGHIARNPCQGMALPMRADDAMQRIPYDAQDLKRIFTSGVFATPLPPVDRLGADHWLPVLALFTGARLEELGQLNVSDIKLIDGIDCIKVTDLDEAGQTARSEKSIKTAAACRVIPLHATLMNCGFLRFVEAQRAKRLEQLFPELPLYRGRRTKEWSKKWGRFTNKHVTTEKEKSFHSFRHLFIRKLRDAAVNKDIIKALVGHKLDDGDAVPSHPERRPGAAAIRPQKVPGARSRSGVGQEPSEFHRSLHP